MGKKKKWKPKLHRDEEGEFYWQVFFVRGKERRRKVRTIDGMGVEEFIERNADDVWLVQHGYFEILHAREEERNRSERVTSGDAGSEDPF